MHKSEGKMCSNEVLEYKTVNNEVQIYKNQIVWRNVITLTMLHVFGFYGWYSAIKYLKWQTFLWSYSVSISSGFGVLAGSHRLWTHRSYKAHWSLRVLLMILQTMALQNDIYEWCRDHRVHHKFSETDAHPHNSKRGFFFAHMGWLLVRKHPQVIEKGKTIDMSDVWADPIVRFQRRFYIPLVILFRGVIPMIVPIYVFDEPLFGLILGDMFCYVASLHQSWLVNSAAHIYGNKPYDSRIEPRDNKLVVYMSLGEGYHNYHHTFPHDYSASEYGWRDNFNVATAFIDFFAWLGLVTERRTVPKDVIGDRIKRTGDGVSELLPKNKIMNNIYGLLYITWPLWTSYIMSIFIR